MIRRRIHDAWSDLRQAARSLKRAPSFSAIVVLTLGLGIGANTAMYSVVDAILLQPLAYPDSERLVTLVVNRPPYGASTYGLTSDEYYAILDGVEGLDRLGVYDYGGGTLTGDGAPPEEPTSFSIDVGLQELTGLTPLVGRAFDEADCERGANPVMMIGEELWTRRYDADPEIVGTRVLLDEREREVIGVVPDSFRFPDETGSFQVFLPRTMGRDLKWWSLGVIGRLAEGVDQAVVDEQLDALSAALVAADADRHPERRLFVRPLQEDVVGDVRPALLLLWTAVGFVLLLACMNAANLLLARSAAREHEIAICAALGSSRWRVAQRVLAESLLLALGAGLVGMLLAQWCIEGVAALGMTDLPRGETIGLDGRMLGVTLVVAVVTGLLYGLLPAWQAGRAELAEAMKEGGGRTSLGARGQRLRVALTIGQVGLACVLLIGAGLMIRSSLAIAGTDPGFVTDDVFGLTMWADTPRDVADEDEDAWVVGFYDDVLERVEAVPGVASAALVNNMPWQTMFDWSVPLTIDDHPAFAAGDERVTTKYRVVSPDYLTEMGVPLLDGRHLEPRDDGDAARVGVVSRTFADRYWPEGDALGARIRIGREREEVEIVGVVGDVRELMLDADPDPVVYSTFAQNPMINATVIVRGELDPAVLERPVQEAVWSVNPTQGIWATRTLDELRRSGLARERLYMQLLVIFAGVAVLLAAVGIYGVISFSVTQRTRELGIRIALGATRGEVMRRVLVRGLRWSAIGLVLGLPAAWLLTRFIEQVLFGITPLDPGTYLGVGLLVAAVTAVACWMPALRATRIEPMECLRAE